MHVSFSLYSCYSYIWKNAPVTSNEYKGQRSCTVAIKYPWLTSCNPDFQIFQTSHGYGTSVTVQDSNTLDQSRLQDSSHCTRFQPRYETSSTISMTDHWCILSYTEELTNNYFEAGPLHYISLSCTFLTECSKILTNPNHL